MTPFNTPQAAERRRDRFLRGTVPAPDWQEVHAASDAPGPEIRGANDPLLQRAEQQLHEAITSIAQSIGVPPLKAGEIATMIQKATPSLRGMSRQQLASLSPSSSLLQSLAATTFAPAMTAEAAQRARLEQIKASYHGTGIDPTDALLLRGERLSLRGLDAYGALGARGMLSGSRESASGSGYTSISAGSLSWSGGTLTGMSPTLYREQFQSYYGTGPQGYATASRVANVLGNNEGLTGAALVARTREVGHDTGVRLGLDTNIYAPKVANVGKKYSDPIIAHKGILDQAHEAQRRGDTLAQEKFEREFLDKRKALEEQARSQDPAKLGDVAGIYNGSIVQFFRKDYVPTKKNAVELLSSVANSADPQARQRLEEIVAAANTSERGRAMLTQIKPELDQLRTAADLRVSQDTRAGAIDRKIDSVAGDFDAIAASAPAPGTPAGAQSAAAPATPAAGKQMAVAPATGTQTAAAPATPAVGTDKPVVAAAPAAPDPKTAPAVVATAPAPPAAKPPAPK